MVFWLIYFGQEEFWFLSAVWSSVNWRIFYVNIEKLVIVQMVEWKLCHSMMIDDTKYFLKKLCSILKRGILFIFFVVHGKLLTGMILKRYFYLECSFSKFLWKRLIFLKNGEVVEILILTLDCFFFGRLSNSSCDK